jgi:probable F420-dependent oxidoreductase
MTGRIPRKDDKDFNPLFQFALKTEDDKKMKIGIQTFFTGQEREPLGDYVAAAGKILEEREFGSVWVSEHVVTFRDYDRRYPYPYSDDGIAPGMLSRIGIVDPLTTLTALAMCTAKIKLASGVAILPQRNPLYFAKESAGIDLLSGGRFVAGIGLGWSAQEYAALGVPWEHRGARMDEYIQIIQSLWQDEVPKFDGKFYQLPECVQLPKPLQRPHPPFYIGGESAAALRRIAALGQGWVAFLLTPDALAKRLKDLSALLAEKGRSLADIDIVVCPGIAECDPAMLAQYAALGVSQVIAVCMAEDINTFRQRADVIAESMAVPAARL